MKAVSRVRGAFAQGHDKGGEMKRDSADLKVLINFYKAKLSAEVQKIDIVRQVKGETKTDHVVIDTRDPASFATGHIPGAINLPLAEAESRLKTLKLQKDRSYVTYCYNKN